MKKISAEHLYQLQWQSNLRVIPPHDQLVYSQHRIDRKKEKIYSNLWIAGSESRKPFQFTQGDQSDYLPRVSPGGEFIAFLSNRDHAEQSQIYVIPVNGGEARKLTEMKGRFSEIEWSPQGDKLLVVFTRKDKNLIEMEKNEQKKKLGLTSRKIRRVFYKSDGEGFLSEQRSHLWLINAKNGKAENLTDHDIFDEYLASWSPDGKKIIFCSNRSQDPDLFPEKSGLYELILNTGKIREIKTFRGTKFNPAYSPDGKYVSFFGTEGIKWWKNTSLWIVPTDGSSPPLNLTGKHDLNAGGWTINDFGHFEIMPPLWGKDGQYIYFQAARHGNTHIYKSDRKSQQIELLFDKPGVVGSWGFGKSESNLYYQFSQIQEPGDIWNYNFKTGKHRRLTKINSKVMDRLELGKVEPQWFTNSEGIDIQGWIHKPPGFNRKKKYPSILEIHGGPSVQYGNHFMFEFHYFAAKGYVVYYCNPRGSQGYGEKFADAIANNWGSADYRDLMEWAKAVQKNKYIHPRKKAVTGGSYGGYMTNWIIGHTDQFKAAVTQRSVSNLISMWGTSDGNWIFQRVFGDKEPWKNMENYWNQSPLKYIENAKTPTLIIHSENDLRCSIEQGEQIFVALKKLGVDTVMIRYPEESHGLSRGGRTDRRIDRLRNMLEWFDKYLKKGKKVES
ncbi:MAG: hypothetical protein APR63_11045 [Desulfuromonas sp. SDB]|nr:MAG: hypothetical protein APR63_11045 [Desulfuromonas sp. SDB]